MAAAAKTSIVQNWVRGNMKQKHLESYLSSLPNRVFLNPKIDLEQYPTSAHLTASVALIALSKNDAGPGTSVLDLGCGTGMLGLGFALIKSDTVYLVDCDSEALGLAGENLDALVEEELIGDQSEGGCFAVELIAAKVEHVSQKDNPTSKYGKRNNSGNVGRNGRKGRSGGKRRGKGREPREVASSSSISNQPEFLSPSLPSARGLSTDSCSKGNENDGIPLPSNFVDTVITNPPFGTKNNEGIDVQFLRTSIRLARRAVYSFHKTSTRPFLLKLLRDTWGLNVEVVAEMKFDIPNMYKFHKLKSVDVEVDLIRVFWDEDENYINCKKHDGCAKWDDT